MDGSLAALQARLQHTFSDPRLLQLALTHRSFSADHNERLEFLGDSVLNLAVSHLLYQRLSALPEGDLSRVRANLVKQDTLHRLAVGLALSPLLRLGEGDMVIVYAKVITWQKTLDVMRDIVTFLTAWFVITSVLKK